MSEVRSSRVLAYYKYLGRDSQSVYSTRYFCGDCRRGISGIYGGDCYGRPEFPEQLEAENESPHGLSSWEPSDQPLDYYAFCPWCGVEFEDEWWKDRTIQNERAIDHYQNPGTHKGDTHEFRGDGPDCAAGHWLSVSGGGKLCWCDPEVKPGLMGCVIRHQDKRYEAAAAEKEPRQAMACLTCGLAGAVPDEHFPQEPGLWDRPCPQCGEQTVWVTETKT